MAVPLGAAASATIGVAVVFGLLYDWPLKSTAFSVVPYLIAFGLLPAFVVIALPGRPLPPSWLVAAAALLGAGAHFANVLPDLADDAATGVRGLPHRIGAAGSRLAASALLLGATVTLVLGPPGAPSWSGWAAGAAAVVVGRPVALFRAVIVVALIDVVLLISTGPVV